jgi:phosphopantothenoylcysteine decarboxylase/phosphopantothenate--cysteine ligase
MARLGGKTIVLGISGGIAAYKSAELTRLMVKAGAEVHVVMTTAAQKFVTPLVLQTLSGHRVMTDLFDLMQESEIGHIALADRADLMLVAPATADVLARLCAGMADDPVTTVALATRARVLVAPAMNVNMWEHPMTRANVDRLGQSLRYLVAGPAAGQLACGWVGLGRMLEPPEIVNAVEHALTNEDLAGLSVLVTAGPTLEPLDPVRYLGNRSSGKMGYALAAEAALRGARVTLVSGPVALPAPPLVERVQVETAIEMQAAVAARSATVDAIVMAAAVSDFRPRERAPAKIGKRGAGASQPLELLANPDILRELGAARRGPRPLLVGFAAETTFGDPRALVAAARRKLEEKACDVILANDVSAPGTEMASDQNRVLVVAAGGAEPEAIGPAAKTEVARVVWDRLRDRLRAP